MAMETAAIYCRLSQDDGSVGESGSIQTQKTLLTQYCKEHHIKVGDCYCDDGWSGTNFDRPNFKRMIDDIELGKVNMVIVKDACDIIRLNAKPLWHNGLAFSSKILVAFLTPLLFGISRGVLIFL